MIDSLMNPTCRHERKFKVRFRVTSSAYLSGFEKTFRVHAVNREQAYCRAYLKLRSMGLEVTT
jgi:hypothetical protein